MSSTNTVRRAPTFMGLALAVAVLAWAFGLPSAARAAVPAAPDSSFAGGVTRPFAPAHAAAGVSLAMADGSTVVVGSRLDVSRKTGNLRSPVHLAKLDASGRPVADYGNEGVSVDEPLPANAWGSPTAAVAEPSGAVVVAFTYFRLADGRDDIRWEMALARYDASGRRDTTFGVSGLVRRPIPDGGAAISLHRQSTGRLLTLVARGWTAVIGEPREWGFSVLAFTAAGQRDTTWGLNGVVRVGGLSGAFALLADDAALASGGRLVVLVAEATTRCDRRRCRRLTTARTDRLYRFTPDGALDHTFGPSGIRRTHIARRAGRLSGNAVFALLTRSRLALHNDDTMTVASSGLRGGVLLRRYRGDGSVDTAFGPRGVRLGTFGWRFGPAVEQMSVDPSGRTLIAGSTGFEYGDVGLMRFDAGGRPDRTFEQGLALLSPGSRREWFTTWAAGLHHDPSGRPVVAIGAMRFDDRVLFAGSAWLARLTGGHSARILRDMTIRQAGRRSCGGRGNPCRVRSPRRQTVLGRSQPGAAVEVSWYWSPGCGEWSILRRQRVMPDDDGRWSSALPAERAVPGSWVVVAHRPAAGDVPAARTPATRFVMGRRLCHGSELDRLAYQLVAGRSGEQDYGAVFVVARSSQARYTRADQPRASSLPVFIPGQFRGPLGGRHVPHPPG